MSIRSKGRPDGEHAHPAPARLRERQGRRSGRRVRPPVRRRRRPPGAGPSPRDRARSRPGRWRWGTSACRSRSVTAPGRTRPSVPRAGGSEHHGVRALSLGELVERAGGGARGADRRRRRVDRRGRRRRVHAGARDGPLGLGAQRLRVVRAEAVDGRIHGIGGGEQQGDAGQPGQERSRATAPGSSRRGSMATMIGSDMPQASLPARSATSARCRTVVGGTTHDSRHRPRMTKRLRRCRLRGGDAHRAATRAGRPLPSTAGVELRETHISWVLLKGDPRPTSSRSRCGCRSSTTDRSNSRHTLLPTRRSGSTGASPLTSYLGVRAIVPAAHGRRGIARKRMSRAPSTTRSRCAATPTTPTLAPPPGLRRGGARGVRLRAVGAAAGGVPSRRRRSPASPERSVAGARGDCSTRTSTTLVRPWPPTMATRARPRRRPSDSAAAVLSGRRGADPPSRAPLGPGPRRPRRPARRARECSSGASRSSTAPSSTRRCARSTWAWDLAFLTMDLDARRHTPARPADGCVAAYREAGGDPGDDDSRRRSSRPTAGA